MKNYAPENGHFQLPFNFDVTLLQKDFEKCVHFEFLQNYVPANYNGKNYILPLRSIDGAMNFPSALPGHSHRFKNTKALDECTYFQEVLDAFQCEKEAARLMNLPAGAVVNMHTDHELGYEDGVFRVHIPIHTNEGVVFTLNGTELRMKEGEAWYTNVNLPHGVVNTGTSARVNLVFDCIRNAWTDALFEKLGYRFDLEYEKEETLSRETILGMIREFEMQDTDLAKQMVADLKAQLADH